MPETVVHFQIRMPPFLHEKFATWARDEKSSVNALVVSVLQQAVANREAEMVVLRIDGARPLSLERVTFHDAVDDSGRKQTASGRRFHGDALDQAARASFA